jgi:hypothetical protein
VVRHAVRSKESFYCHEDFYCAPPGYDTVRWRNTLPLSAGWLTSTLKMEATFSPETLVPTYEATRRYESENHNISEQLRIAFRNSKMVCCVSVKLYTDSVRSVQIGSCLHFSSLHCPVLFVCIKYVKFIMLLNTADLFETFCTIFYREV